METTNKSGWLLDALKSPIVFNAFIVLMLVLLIVFGDGAPDFALGDAILLIAGITIWVNVLAKWNGRALTYGPRDYLRQSELELERAREAAQISTTPPEILAGAPQVPDTSLVSQS